SLLHAPIGRSSELLWHRRGLEPVESAERTFGSLDQRLALFALRQRNLGSLGHQATIPRWTNSTPSQTTNSTPRPPEAIANCLLLRLRSARAASVNVSEIVPMTGSSKVCSSLPAVAKVPLILPNAKAVPAPAPAPRISTVSSSKGR